MPGYSINPKLRLRRIKKFLIIAGMQLWVEPSFPSSPEQGAEGNEANLEGREVFYESVLYV